LLDQVPLLIIVIVEPTTTEEGPEIKGGTEFTGGGGAGELLPVFHLELTWNPGTVNQSFGMYRSRLLIYLL
jgi:hypothetical protein